MKCQISFVVERFILFDWLSVVFLCYQLKNNLYQLKNRLAEAQDLTKELAAIIQSVADKLPNFTRETEYIGLTSDEEYALIRW